jgi:Carbamoyltransferase N-terminus
VNSVGEWTTASLGIGRGTDITLLKEIRFPHSVGLLYSAFTAFLGFEVNEGEYKVMGMAPFGTLRYINKVYKLIRVSNDGSSELDMRVTEPKRPGRKPGTGPFQYREEPLPETLTEPPVDVKVPLEACPTCGRPLVEERIDFAYRTKLPELPRPQVTCYRVWVCRCTACGIRVRGQHPDLAPDQYGATAHRLGPRVMAAAHVLQWGGDPGAQGPSGVGRLDGGAAEWPSRPTPRRSIRSGLGIATTKSRR